MSKANRKVKLTIHLDRETHNALIELGATERTFGALISTIVLAHYARVKLDNERAPTPIEIAAELHRLADRLTDAQ